MGKKQNKEEIKIQLEETEELQNVEEIMEETEEKDINEKCSKDITKENSFFILDKILGLVMKENDTVEKDTIIKIINDLVRRLNILFN